MACNSCSKPYTLFRKEKGCPSCGFSYCGNCLNDKVFVKKLNREEKVCSKCKRSAGTDEKTIVVPPDAYYKRIGSMSNDESNSKTFSKSNDTEEEIRKRLLSLKEDKNDTRKGTTNEEISQRLQNIKGPQPTTSDAELQLRLANLKGLPAIGVQNKPMVIVPDTRTEQEQANDLMKQYMEQANIDTQYQHGFNKQIDDIEARILKLRTSNPAPDTKTTVKHENSDSEDEETIIKKIIEKAKAESSLQDDNPTSTAENDELPFCEICNEDARLRCLGCRYLFCKQCFKEHKDDDDGCNRYEPYTPPKN